MRNSERPPLWLLAFLGLAYGQSLLYPAPLFGAYGDWPGYALTVAGLVLMIVAAAQMILAKTSLRPGRQAGVLLTRGAFRISRNPMYLGDALVLLGLILVWDAWPSLVLVPILVLVITRRFILWEEEQLLARFREDYDAYVERTRRWI